MAGVWAPRICGSSLVGHKNIGKGSAFIFGGAQLKHQVLRKEALMKPIVLLCGTKTPVLFALILFLFGGCAEVTPPTAPGSYTSSTYSPPPALSQTSVDGIWIGSGTYTEPPTYNNLSVIGDFTRTANSVSGTLVWIIPTPDTTIHNPYFGYKTTVTVTVSVWMNTITIQQRGGADPNSYATCAYLTGTVSGDVISCTRWASSTSRKVIGTLKLVRWK
jgi:hypothetical protein